MGCHRRNYLGSQEITEAGFSEVREHGAYVLRKLPGCWVAFWFYHDSVQDCGDKQPRFKLLIARTSSARCSLVVR